MTSKTKSSKLGPYHCLQKRSFNDEGKRKKANTMSNEIKIPIESYDDFKKEVAELLSSCFEELLEEGGLSSEGKLSASDMVKMLERPPESSLGDYAFPCFRFAKAFRKKPNLIAEALGEKLVSKNLPLISHFKVVGAFLNLYMNPKALAFRTLKGILSGETFKVLEKRGKSHSGKTMIEFSQPNTHKEFHVGHGRNVCLGDALCRLYEYSGFDLIRANYFGDEGTHVAKAIWQIKKEASIPQGSSLVEFYGACYTKVSQKLKEADKETKKKIDQEICEILANLESKKGDDYDLWLKTRQECLDEFSDIYKWLDVRFDTIFYESEVSEESQNIVDEFIQKGLFKESEGAVGLDLEDVDLGFFMARKSDGSTPYITKDLALARRKFEDYSIQNSIYVVGSEQKFHFKQLFEVLGRMGFKQASQCFHLSYAHVVLPEGKMSSRVGNTFTFKQLMNIMDVEVRKKLVRYENEWTSEEIDDAAHRLCLGAIRYGMLSSDPNKEIIFDPDLWTSFEGNTGPYLMYSYARTASILRKANVKTQSASLTEASLGCLNLPLELDLIRKMYDFNHAIRQSLEQRKPSLLAHYLYELCKEFSRFYVNVPVLKAEEESLKEARLMLLEAFSLVLKKGLSLLGMTAPEKM